MTRKQVKNSHSHALKMSPTTKINCINVHSTNWPNKYLKLQFEMSLVTRQPVKNPNHQYSTFLSKKRKNTFIFLIYRGILHEDAISPKKVFTQHF